MKIKTYDGTYHEQTNCRKIKGEYYIKNVQCFEFDGKWYRINSGSIDIDHETKKWFIYSNIPRNVIEGIIGYENSKRIIGYFTMNPKRNVSVYTKEGLMLAFDESVLPKNIRFFEGIFFEFGTNTLTKIPNESLYGYTLPYRTKDTPEGISLLHTPLKSDKEFLRRYESLITPLLKYSWGIEIETSSGRLPLKDCLINNLFPLRDGSISGIEYTTPPMTRMNNFYTLYEGLEALKRRDHQINEFCSLHVHIGGIEENCIPLLYQTIIWWEKIIYKLFPPFYVHTSRFKKRDYNNPLQRLKKITNETIFESLLRGKNLPYGLYPSHPSDPNNSRKWDIEERYTIVNFINYYFSTSRTIEFRIHTPTLNFDKIILWLLFINGIVDNVRKGDIPVSMKDILVYTPQINALLNKYFTLRKRWYGKKGRDSMGIGEVYFDNRFSIDKL